MKKIFIIFFIISLIFSLSSNFKDGGDDLFYKTASLNSSLPSFINQRYFNWTGRVTSETLAYLFNNSLEFLWPIINAAMMTFLSIIIFNYTNLLAKIKDNKKSLLAIITCLTFLLIEKSVIDPSFLWKTGSLNYLWPVTMGLIAFYPFLLSIKNKLNKVNYLFYFLISLIASISMEQMSVALYFGLITYFIYMFINKKKIPLIIYLITFNILIGSMILFLAPGNQVRLQAEANHNFPGFLSLSLFNRISISIYWFLNKIINTCSLSLAAIYLVLGIKNYPNKNTFNNRHCNRNFINSKKYFRLRL